MLSALGENSTKNSGRRPLLGVVEATTKELAMVFQTKAKSDQSLSKKCQKLGPIEREKEVFDNCSWKEVQELLSARGMKVRMFTEG